MIAAIILLLSNIQICLEIYDSIYSIVDLLVILTIKKSSTLFLTFIIQVNRILIVIKAGCSGGFGQVCMSVHLSIHLPIHPSVHPSILNRSFSSLHNCRRIAQPSKGEEGLHHGQGSTSSRSPTHKDKQPSLTLTDILECPIYRCMSYFRTVGRSKGTQRQLMMTRQLNANHLQPCHFLLIYLKIPYTSYIQNIHLQL